MGHGYHLTNKASPVLKECNLEGCKNKFWGYGSDKYCSLECVTEAELISSRERSKRWREKNPEKSKQYSSDYYQRHKEYYREYGKQYRKNKAKGE